MDSSLEESREFYRKFFAEETDITYDNRQRYKIVYSLINDLPLDSDATVLDVGAGSGRITRFLHDRFTSVTPVDIVISPLLKETVDELGLSPIEGALPDLPVADNTFDLVVCSEVLEHLAERETQIEAVRELSRVTADGGWVVISTPNPRSLHHKSQNLIFAVGKWVGVVEKDSDSGQYIENWIPPSQLREVVESEFNLIDWRGSYYNIADLGAGWRQYLYPISDKLTEANIAPSYGLYQYYIGRS